MQLHRKCDSEQINMRSLYSTLQSAYVGDVIPDIIAISGGIRCTDHTAVDR